MDSADLASWQLEAKRHNPGHALSELYIMDGVEPGTYRIVNLARNKAIRVPDEYPDTIASWQSKNEANQKWFVERVGGGYRFKNCLHGRYLAVHGTQCNSRAYHGQSPTTWKIVPHIPSGYFIQLEAADRVLDLHDRGEVYIWPKNDSEPQKIWNFERLNDDVDDESNQTRTDAPLQTHDIAEKEQSPTPVDKGPIDQGQLIEQVARQSQLIAEQNRQIAEQREQLANLQRQIEEKDRKLAEVHRDMEVMAPQRSTSGQVPRDPGQAVPGTSALIDSEDIKMESGEESSEVVELRDKVKRLEALVAQLFDQEFRVPNNMT